MLNEVKLCIIESDRLLYKPISLEHADKYYVDWLNDPEVNKYLEVNKENNLTELEQYIQESIEKNIFFWAIHIKETGKHIGNIKIDPINKKHGTGEYGIMMGDKNEWGKGYAKEASLTIIDFCFQNMNLRKMTLGVVEDNISAVELYKKIGFAIEGKYINHNLYDGIYHNVLRMATFNPNYKY